MGRFQFSLRTLLVAVAVVGIGASLWVAEPSWQVGAVEFLLVPCVLASAAMLTVHSEGAAKSFWMGFAAECIMPVFVYLPVIVCFSVLVFNHIGTPVPALPDISLDVLKAMSKSFHPVLLAWAFAPIVGLLCVFTHWLFIRLPESR